MVLHAPSLHFHIGAWFVTAACTILAIIINYFQKKNFLNMGSKFDNNLVDKLDFTAHVSGIIGLVGILAASYLGLIDASGADFRFNFESIDSALNSVLFFLDFNVPLEGFEKAINHQLLGYKVVWALAGMQLYLCAGIIRFYFVTIKKTRIYDLPLGIQLIYSGAALCGFLVMVAISATGGIYSYNKSFIEDIPILQNLLPGYDIPLLQILTISFALFAVLMLLSSFFFKKKELSS